MNNSGRRKSLINEGDIHVTVHLYIQLIASAHSVLCLLCCHWTCKCCGCHSGTGTSYQELERATIKSHSRIKACCASSIGSQCSGVRLRDDRGRACELSRLTLNGSRASGNSNHADLVPRSAFPQSSDMSFLYTGLVHNACHGDASITFSTSVTLAV